MTCTYQPPEDSDLREDYTCPHTTWVEDDQSLCIFHSSLWKQKKSQFKDSFKLHLRAVEANREIETYNFLGYIIIF